jgi:hypothetical protein
MTEPTLQKDGDRYLVLIDGEVIDEVYKSRGTTGRYRMMGGTGYMKGSTRWCAGKVSDEDYATRKEAVAETVRRWERRQAAVAEINKAMTQEIKR